MINRMKKVLLAGTAVLLFAPTSWAALSSYSQNFEALVQANADALGTLPGGAGFVISGVVFDGAAAPAPYGNFDFFYGNFTAPNGGAAFSAIVTGQTGPAQGLQALSVYSDYNCCGPSPGPTLEGHNDNLVPIDYVQSNVFREQVIGPADIGTTWAFRFDGKANTVDGCATQPATDCVAFIRTLDPTMGFAQTNFVTFDSQANLTANWSTQSISIDLSAPALNGQILQFGFQSTTRSFQNSGTFYDNISFGVDGDLDGVPNIVDNCRTRANPNQVDSNGDGFGNRCDGDLNNNGSTNAFDTPLYRAQLGQPSVPPLYNAADLNTNGSVNAFDTPIYRSLLGAPPGPGAGP